jgi:hypothetical protein
MQPFSIRRSPHFHSGLKITCKSDEFQIFSPPFGQTCATWANEFITGFGGYLDNPSDTSDCRYCQYAVGDEFFAPLNISYDNRWRDTWVLFAFCGACSYVVLDLSADGYCFSFQFHHRSHRLQVPSLCKTIKYHMLISWHHALLYTMLCRTHIRIPPHPYIAIDVVDLMTIIKYWLANLR